MSPVTGPQSDPAIKAADAAQGHRVPCCAEGACCCAASGPPTPCECAHGCTKRNRPSLRDSGPDPADRVAEEMFLIRAAVARGAVKPATIRSLLAAVEAVAALHQPVSKLTRLGPPATTMCKTCGEIWVSARGASDGIAGCSTVRTISRALIGEGDQ